MFMIAFVTFGSSYWWYLRNHGDVWVFIGLTSILRTFLGIVNCLIDPSYSMLLFEFSFVIHVQGENLKQVSIALEDDDQELRFNHSEPFNNKDESWEEYGQNEKVMNSTLVRHISRVFSGNVE